MYHALEEIVEIVATGGGTGAIFIQSHQTQISFLIPVFFDNLSAGTVPNSHSRRRLFYTV
jgi:hypothetical protein